MKSFFKFLIESAEQKQKIIQVLKDNGYSDFKKDSIKRIVIKAGGSREEHLTKIERLFPNATWNKRNTKNSSVGVIELEGGFEIIIKPAFGGGSGAGAALTKIVESAQCLYCAAALYGKRKYDKEDLESVKNHIDIDAKIEGMESYEFERRNYPHPRSPEALKIQAQRWGVTVGTNFAEAFCLIRLIN